MKNYVEYFSISAVAWTIAKYYARMSAKCQSPLKRNQSNNIDDRVDPVCIDLHSLIPPRSLRIRYGAAKRNRLGNARCQISSIYDTIMMYSRKGDLHKHAWGQRFLLFVDKVSVGALSGSREAAGGLVVFPKYSVNVNNVLKVRMLCSFDSLEDRVFWSLLSRYLRDLLELITLPAVHSFRRHHSHNTAAASILSYIREHTGSCVWVSEVDVVGLFDAIRHDIVLSSLDALKTKLNVNGVFLDARAETFVQQYLSLYSLQLLSSGSIKVVGKSSIDNLLRMASHPGPKKSNNDTMTPKVQTGIPQGGPLSPTLSNLVLHFVDERVLAVDDPDLLYLRYCDDAIFLHTKRLACDAASIRFCEGLECQQLHAHPFVAYNVDNALCANAKSKRAYPWDTLNQDGVTWIKYLGYEFRSDGAVRIGQESIQRMKRNLDQRQNELVNYFSSMPIMPNPLTVYFSIRYSFLSMIFGRSFISDAFGMIPVIPNHRKLLCWHGAFPLLMRGNCDDLQLRQMDRYLEASISSCLHSLVKRAELGTVLPRLLRSSRYIKIARSLNFYTVISAKTEDRTLDADAYNQILSSLREESLPVKVHKIGSKRVFWRSQYGDSRESSFGDEFSYKSESPFGSEGSFAGDAAISGDDKLPF